MRLAVLGFVIFAVACTAHAEPPKRPATKPVSIRGQLESGMMAIGGETTGTQVTSHGRVYELEFVTKPELRDVADRLTGNHVTATGSLRLTHGIERKERWILDVIEVKPVEVKSPSDHDHVPSYPYEASTQKVDTKASVLPVPGELHIHIRSTSGIDTVSLKRNSGVWPEKVLLHFHLKGLESCILKTNEQELGWSVQNSGMFAFRTWSVIHNQEKVLTTDDPLYSPVVRRETLFQSAGTIDDQEFVIAIPEGILTANPQSMSIQFIDFYR